MPKFIDIKYEQHEFFKIAGLPWLREAANHPGLAQGGIYLLSGPPGGGKTTIALQISCEMASCGVKVLYLALEQSPGDLKHKVEKQIFKDRRRARVELERGANQKKEGLEKAGELLQLHKEEERIAQNLFIDSSVNGMESLPDFLARQVLGYSAPYSEAKLIVVDSIQGLGTAPTSSKPYQRLFEFNRWAKEHGMAVILIGHITKGGAIAGPRSLEHNVDCVFYLRKAMKLRPLFVPKNRFGPERHEPLTLIMNDNGCLEKSKHAKAKASSAFGFLPGPSGDLLEVQALVKLPKFGDKAGIKAPYLPKQKLIQLVGIISSLHEIDISDLTFEINCAIPGGRPYRETLDLPLAMSMLSSYFQRQIPPGSLFIGEVDLFHTIRPVTAVLLGNLVDLLSLEGGSAYAHIIERIYISEDNKSELVHLITQANLNTKVCGVSSLDKVMEIMWPEIIEK
ncbi:MAG: AAA family ATPase [Candidatus Omnitrophica bacterium]|nr:AAA family ATPase [Candidatus Omnitrophota bacterium]